MDSYSPLSVSLRCYCWGGCRKDSVTKWCCTVSLFLLPLQSSSECGIHSMGSTSVLSKSVPTSFQKLSDLISEQTEYHLLVLPWFLSLSLRLLCLLHQWVLILLQCTLPTVIPFLMLPGHSSLGKKKKKRKNALCNDQPVPLFWKSFADGNLNSMVKARCIGNQSIQAWCYFSTAIPLRNQYFLQIG